MFRPFRLKRPIDPNANMDLDDVLATKRALVDLGFMDLPDYGLTPHPDQPMIDGIKAFQFRHRLRVDGVMKPDGPTLETLNRTLAERLPAPAPTPGEFSRLPRPDRRSFFDVPLASVRPDPDVMQRANLAGTEAFGTNRPGSNARPSGLEPLDEPDKTGMGPKSTENQLAAVPAAIPFAVWLMPILGAATAAAAMAIYNKLSKPRRDQLRRQYEQDSEFRNDPYYARFVREKDKCFSLPPKWRAGCMERATTRWDMCNRNGGRPDPNEPPEWSNADMEETPPRSP